jgi:hypothetical protein
LGGHVAARLRPRPGLPLGRRDFRDRHRLAPRRAVAGARASLSSRPRAATAGGIKTLLTRSAPPHELEKNIVFQHYSGYAWHISMFIVLLFFAPHMLFFKDILGFGWPTLPNLFITFFTVVTMGILLVLLARRMMNPVLRQISTWTTTSAGSWRSCRS